jgi:hypothetical protein
MRGISWLAENLLASEEELSSVELIDVNVDNFHVGVTSQTAVVFLPFTASRVNGILLQDT